MKTKSLLITPTQSQDINEIVTILMDERVRESDGSGYKEDSVRETFELVNHFLHNFTVKLEDKIIGCAQLVEYWTGSYEISFHFHPDYWNKGYASETCKALINHAFFNLNADSVNAIGVREGNTSIKVLEKHGFTAKNKYRDEPKVTYTLDKKKYFQNKA